MPKFDTYRMRQLEAEVQRRATVEAIKRVTEGVQRDEEGRVLLLAAPSRGYLSLEDKLVTKEVAAILGVAPTSDDIAKVIRAVGKTEVDKLALSGWHFSTGETRNVGSVKLDDGFELATEHSLRHEATGEVAMRDDIPHFSYRIELQHRNGDRILSGVWIFPDGRCELDAASFDKTGEFPEDYDLSPQGRADATLLASLNRTKAGLEQAGHFKRAWLIPDEV
ncbi:hypothetical protein JK202_13310 [Gluconobacter sp. Dm-62]|uniref:hypothetical protein n=1 Tax=Gluconobacter TaxID=441 RepID=UPI001B8BCEC9|nr:MULTISPECIES: hypothetical protein [Gluconobacter]MBS1080875.1 hypothetical protein [Gluconobacter kondonii]MBS1103971.1 hypothetical protein [Gluconobacter sp. Dm-62]